MQQGRLRRWDRAILYAYPVLDTLVVIGSMLFVYWLYIGFDRPMPQHYRAVCFSACLIVPLWFGQFGGYRAYRGETLGIEVLKLLLALGGLFSAFAVFLLLTKSGALYSRVWMGGTVVLSAASLTISRFFLRFALNEMRQRGFNRRYVILVGTKARLSWIERKLSGFSTAGLSVVAEVELQEDTGNVPRDLALLLSRYDVDQVWISSSMDEMTLLKDIKAAIAGYSVDVRWVPDGWGSELIEQEVRVIAGIPTVSVHAPPLGGAAAAIKMLEDRCIALVAILLLSPLFILVAIAIKIDSRGPVLFKQLRHGWNGREVKVYKFRTMHVHDEAQDLIQAAARNDARVTRVGRWLRSTSIDETPQFFNVLQGRMSIVGPRPHPLSQKRAFEAEAPEWVHRYSVRPGITGWAQINGYRGEIETQADLKKRIEYDLYYIKHWSLLLDIKIIFMSVFRGWVHTKAY